jgi:hypothetical protein
LFNILSADLDISAVGLDEHTVHKLHKIYPLVYGHNPNTTTTTISSKRKRGEEVDMSSEIKDKRKDALMSEMRSDKEKEKKINK